MQSHYYKNLSFVAFGEPFYGKTPSQVLHHFKARSPFYRDASARDYADHLSVATGAPVMGDDESFEAYAERMFDDLIDKGIVVFDGSETAH
jgi:hypothetical protein